MRKRAGFNSYGFTLVEMLVAMSVFSVVLLLCAVGLLQISHTFYKGVTITKTQEVARTAIEDISGNFQYNGASFKTLTPSGSVRGYCVGNTRYSYIPGVMLPETGGHALVADTVDCNTTTTALSFSANPWPSTARELLSPRMRVSAFSITPPPDSTMLYTIRIKLTTGQDDMLSNPGDDSAACLGAVSGSQYCASVELTTTVQKRV